MVENLMVLAIIAAIYFLYMKNKENLNGKLFIEPEDDIVVVDQTKDYYQKAQGNPYLTGNEIPYSDNANFIFG